MTGKMLFLSVDIIPKYGIIFIYDRKTDGGRFFGMKKRIRKSFTMFLCVIMCSSLLPGIHAQAEDAGVIDNDTAALYVLAESDSGYDGALTIGTVGDKLPGTEVTIPVILTENPGVAALDLQIVYDTTRLELTGYSNAGLTGWAVGVGGGERAVWVSLENATSTGTILNLKFTVLDGAEDGFAEVTITDMLAVNCDEEVLTFSVTAGGVNVVERIPGDVTGDGKVNSMDMLRLIKYLNGLDVAVVSGSVDINGDGKESIMDLIRLMKYLSGVAVELH